MLAAFGQYRSEITAFGITRSNPYHQPRTFDRLAAGLPVFGARSCVSGSPVLPGDQAKGGRLTENVPTDLPHVREDASSRRSTTVEPRR